MARLCIECPPPRATRKDGPLPSTDTAGRALGAAFGWTLHDGECPGRAGGRGLRMALRARRHRWARAWGRQAESAEARAPRDGSWWEEASESSLHLPPKCQPALKPTFFWGWAGTGAATRTSARRPQMPSLPASSFPRAVSIRGSRALTGTAPQDGREESVGLRTSFLSIPCKETNAEKVHCSPRSKSSRVQAENSTRREFFLFS